MTHLTSMENKSVPAPVRTPKPRGGFRPGSGRKRISYPENKRLRLSTTISPETLAFLEQARKQPWLNQGRVIDLLLSLAQDSPRFRQIFSKP